MDSIKGQGGIQMLLTAEQEAQHIVSSARNCKNSCFCSRDNPDFLTHDINLVEELYIYIYIYLS